MAVCGGLAERHSFGLVRSSFCVMERAPERRFVSAVSGPGPSIAGRASGSGPHPLSPNREPGPRLLHEWNRNHRLMIEPTMSDTHAQYEPVARGGSPEGGSGENSETAVRRPKSCRRGCLRLSAS